MSQHCLWCGRLYDDYYKIGGGFCSAKCRTSYEWEHGGKQREEEALARKLRASMRAELEEVARKNDPARWYGSEWVEHLKCHPEDAGKCRWETLEAKDIMKLLVRQPEFVSHCNMAKLSSDDWAKLLEQNEDFADLCTAWSSMSAMAWARLLKWRGRLAKFCPADKWSSFSGDELAAMLKSWPSLLSYVKNWSALSPDNWIMLLTTRPELIEYCDWSGFDEDQKRKLVVEAHSSCKWPWELLDGVMWSALLSVRPEKATRCNWEKLSGKDWKYLLRFQPQFFDRCDDWSEIESKVLISLLKQHPECATQNRLSAIGIATWFNLIMELPEYAQRCDKWDLFNPEWVTHLVSEHPELLHYCASLIGQMDPDELKRLLRVHPELILSQSDLSSSEGLFTWASLGEDFILELVSAICKQFSQSQSNALMKSFIPYVVKHPSIEERVPWKELGPILANMDWGLLTDDQRVEFVADVGDEVSVAIEGGFSPNALRPWCLWMAMRKWPEKCKDFDPDKYDWSKCSPRMWCRIGWDFPQYVKYCDATKVDWKALDQEEISFWVLALGWCPEGVIECFHDWGKITPDLWDELIGHRPMMGSYRSKYCPKSKPPEKDSPQAAESVPPPSAVRDSDQKTDARENVNRPSPSKTESPDQKPGLVKKYWMPALAVLFILSAFGEGGAASFFIGAGLGAFWWWKKRRG